MVRYLQFTKYTSLLLVSLRTVTLEQNKAILLQANESRGIASLSWSSQMDRWEINWGQAGSLGIKKAQLYVYMVKRIHFTFGVIILDFNAYHLILWIFSTDPSRTTDCYEWSITFMIVVSMAMVIGWEYHFEFDDTDVDRTYHWNDMFKTYSY